MSLAPVALFTYKRTDTLEKTISNLQKNFLAKDTVLFIFSDGPKNPRELEEILKVRKFLRTVDGFKAVIIHESKENRGLANSIIKGVTEVLDSHDSVIVLEDDLYSQPNFLNFMNVALERYQDSKEILSVCGYSFDLNLEHINCDDYFLNRPWPWSWAIWKDRWIKIDWSVSDYSEFSKKRKSRVEFAKLGSDVNAMLDKQMRGEIDSWAIRWTYHQYKNNMLSVFPRKSLVFNGGFDEFATHTKGSAKRYIPQLDESMNTSFNLSKKIYLDPIVQKSFQRKMSIKSRIISKLQTLHERFTRKT